MKRESTKQINIEIQCDLTPGWGGERWDVKEVTDKDTGFEFGPIEIYDFDAYSDFPSAFLEAVLTLLHYEVNEFSEKDRFYSVRVEINSGGARLGLATHHGYGFQLIEMIEANICESDKS